MAMSLKKIGAIAIGGAMVATALASGVAAEVTVVGGSLSDIKDILVKDGQPNCYVVVGANAPSTMDVVSAADIAAKIGSLCYKEGTVNEGCAELNVHVTADASKEWFNTSKTENYTYIVTPDNTDYSLDEGILFGNDLYYNNNGNTSIVTTESLTTLMKIDDVDPNSIYTTPDLHKKDGIEIGFFAMKNESNEIGMDLVGYASVVTADGALDTSNTILAPGVLIPFLGQQYMFVKVDTDNNEILIGKPVYSGVLAEGDTYNVGNGYEVKVQSVLEPTSTTGKSKVDIQILKDGQVVAEKFDTADASSGKPLVVVYGPVGVIVTNAYKNVAATTGYADLYIVNDIKRLKLGSTYEGDYKIYAVVRDKNPDQINITKTTTIDSDTVYNISDAGDINGAPICGIALVDDTNPTDDNNKLSSEGDTFSDVDNYITLKVDKVKSNAYEIHAYSDVTKDTTVDLGQTVSVLNADITLKKIEATAEQVVPITAPIAKLDTEVSLDSADKNLVLVGGPVANKLTKELQDMGKLPVPINNTSGPVIEIVKGVANGHDVVVVAGGNREATREAALYLIKNL